MAIRMTIKITHLVVRLRVSPHCVVSPVSRLWDLNSTLTGLRSGSPHSREVLIELTSSAPALAGDSWHPE